MTNVISGISAFLATLSCIMLLIPVAVNTQAKTYFPVYPERIRLNSVLIGDMHTDGDVFRDRNNILRNSLGAIACSENPLDALVIAGDITNAGAEIEYRNLNRMLGYLDKSNQLIPQMGNHDSGGTSEDKDFNNESLLFQEFCKEQGIETETNYYCKTVNGYYFIVLGTEQMLLNEAYISDAQLDWLDNTLTLAEQNGKIAFVICHQPLNGTNGVADLWSDGGLGEQSSQVVQIIKSHTDNGMKVLFVSGHLHAGFSDSSFETISEGFYALNLPSVLHTGSGGLGVIMEVYDDTVLLRAHNFSDNTNEDVARYQIPLNNVE